MKITGTITEINPLAAPFAQGMQGNAVACFDVPLSSRSSAGMTIKFPCTIWRPGTEGDGKDFANICESGEFQIGDEVNVEITKP